MPRGRREGLVLKHTGRERLIPGLDALAADSVRPQTQDQYLCCIRDLLAWLGLAVTAKEETSWWEDALQDYLMRVYDGSGSFSVAYRTLAAVLWGQPHLRGPMRHAFPQAHRCLGGWKRLEPPSSRPPVAYDVACLVAASLRASGQYYMVCRR